MCDLTKSLKSASTFSAAATTFVSFSLSAATSFSQLTDLSVRLCLLRQALVREPQKWPGERLVRVAVALCSRAGESREFGQWLHQEHFPHLFVGPRGLREVGQLVQRQVAPPAL